MPSGCPKGLLSLSFAPSLHRYNVLERDTEFLEQDHFLSLYTLATPTKRLGQEASPTFSPPSSSISKAKADVWLTALREQRKGAIPALLPLRVSLCQDWRLNKIHNSPTPSCQSPSVADFSRPHLASWTPCLPFIWVIH